mmetsp:Transcript_4431/g.15662  ORF Transcript_4431/g.15662 Transcript_4431/m.15662 type:complete len:380 (+) Transcript_4431:2118-3257(+)
MMRSGGGRRFVGGGRSRGCGGGGGGAFFAASASSSMHSLHVHRRGVFSESEIPTHRVCIHTSQTSHAIIRSPSSSHVPHTHLTIHWSNPPWYRKSDSKSAPSPSTSRDAPAIFFAFKRAFSCVDSNPMTCRTLYFARTTYRSENTLFTAFFKSHSIGSGGRRITSGGGFVSIPYLSFFFSLMLRPDTFGPLFRESITAVTMTRTPFETIGGRPLFPAVALAGGLSASMSDVEQYVFTNCFVSNSTLAAWIRSEPWHFLGSPGAVPFSGRPGRALAGLYDSSRFLYTTLTSFEIFSFVRMSAAASIVAASVRCTTLPFPFATTAPFPPPGAAPGVGFGPFFDGGRMIDACILDIPGTDSSWYSSCPDDAFWRRRMCARIV